MEPHENRVFRGAGVWDRPPRQHRLALKETQRAYFRASVGRVIDWHDPIQALNTAALTVAGVPVSWAELLGDVTGALCVLLVARQNVWNWPLGLGNNVFWAVLFYDAKLYGDSFLQAIFFALGCYGWWRWLAPSESHVTLPVRRTTAREWWMLGGLTAAGTLSVATWLAAHTDSPVPWADASVLTLSLAATYGQALKLVESWWVWIGVDVISVPLYVSRGLYPTAALYVVFGLMCIAGLRSWSRSLAEATA